MSTITTLNGSGVIATDRTTINTNFTNLNSDKIETSYLDTDTALTANSDTKIATQKAVKAYVLANVNPTGASWNEYAADAGATDAYAITLTGLTAYATGQTFKFKANTANTGACTLNINGLGAKTIKKDVSSDLATGDILANQIVTVIYDGTNMQMVGQSASTAIAPLNTRALYTVGALDNALVKTYFNMHFPFILWAGSTSGAATCDFPNWTRSDGTDVIIPPMGAMADFRSTGSSYLYLDNFLYAGASAGITYALTNIVIMDWWAKLPASGTGDISMGFADSASTGSIFKAYNDSTENRVLFSQKSTGELYATISKASVGVTNTDISSGLTLGNWNNYRIELTLGTNAKFYVNGVLKATLSGANLPTATNGILMGFGRSNTSLFQVTAPTLSLQMNP